MKYGRKISLVPLLTISTMLMAWATSGSILANEMNAEQVQSRINPDTLSRLEPEIRKKMNALSAQFASGALTVSQLPERIDTLMRLSPGTHEIEQIIRIRKGGGLMISGGTKLLFHAGAGFELKKGNLLVTGRGPVEFCAAKTGSGWQGIKMTRKSRAWIENASFSGINGPGIELKNSEGLFVKTRFIGNQSTESGIVSVMREGRAALVDCEFSDNRSKNNGGALSVWGLGLANVRECIFKNNHSGGDGGAVIVRTASGVQIVESLFEGNISDGNGGAIAIVKDFSLGLLGKIQFRSNKARKDGGAVIVAYQSNMLLTNSDLQQNEANLGGAVMIRESRAVIQGNRFFNNNSTYNGGAVNANADAFGLVMENLFSGNGAGAYGGAIMLRSTNQMALKDNQFKNNRAQEMGGAIMCFQASAENTITASTYSGNYAPDGKDIYQHESNVTVKP